MSDEQTPVRNMLVTAMQELNGVRQSAVSQFSRPRSPLCVLYCGEGSEKLHRDVYDGLDRGWGANVERMCFFGVPSPDAFRENGDVVLHAMGDGAAVTTIDRNAMLGGVESMLSSTGTFVSTTSCYVFMVLDTDGMDADDFAAWFHMGGDVRKRIASLNLRLMLMALTNESLQDSRAERAAAVKRRLHDELIEQGEACPYDSVFVYESRRYDGRFTRLYNRSDDETYTERDVLADIMLLTNSRNIDSHTVASTLFDAGPGVFTAAISYYSKPTREIVLTALTSMLNALAQDADKAKGMKFTADDVRRVVHLEGGRAAFADMYCQRIDDICQKYHGFLAHMPSTDPTRTGQAFAQLSYAQTNDLSCGCLEAFIVAHHLADTNAYLESVDGRSERDHFRNAWRNDFTAVQLADIDAEQLERVTRDMLSSCRIGDDAIASQSVEQSIRGRMLNAFIDAAGNAILETVGALRGDASATTHAFTSIQESVSRLASQSALDDNAKASVDAYYTGVVNAYLSLAENRDRLFRAVFRVGNDEDAILTALLEEGLKPLFDSVYGSQTVFTLNFMDELVTRLAAGKSPEDAQKVIGKELIDDLDGGAGLCTVQSLDDPVMETYLLHHSDDAGSAAGKLEAYLSGHAGRKDVPAAFFDTRGQDAATSIWLYHVPLDRLTA